MSVHHVSHKGGRRGGYTQSDYSSYYPPRLCLLKKKRRWRRRQQQKGGRGCSSGCSCQCNIIFFLGMMGHLQICDSAYNIPCIIAMRNRRALLWHFFPRRKFGGRINNRPSMSPCHFQYPIFSSFSFSFQYTHMYAYI